MGSKVWRRIVQPQELRFALPLPAQSDKHVLICHANVHHCAKTPVLHVRHIEALELEGCRACCPGGRQVCGMQCRCVLRDGQPACAAANDHMP